MLLLADMISVLRFQEFDSKLYEWVFRLMSWEDVILLNDLFKLLLNFLV